MPDFLPICMQDILYSCKPELPEKVIESIYIFIKVDSGVIASLPLFYVKESEQKNDT